MEQDFSFIEAQFRKCDRDAHSIFQWLTNPVATGGKGIPEPIALEVMLEFADLISSGSRLGFNKAGLSILSLSVHAECVRRKRKADAEISTKMLRVLARQSLTDNQFDDLADDLVEMMNMLYEKVDGIKDRKTRIKRYRCRRRKNSIWFMPLSRLWNEKVRGRENE